MAITRYRGKRLPKRLSLVVWINGDDILELSSGIGANKRHLAFSKSIIERLLKKMWENGILNRDIGCVVKLESISLDTGERKTWID